MAQKFASYVNNGTDQINFVGNTYFVKGTQTASTNAWTGALPGNLQAYYDGLTIDYFLPYAGTSTAATLNLSSKGAKPVYYRGTGGVTTHYPANSVIHLTYIASLNSGNGAWESTAWYDSNSTYSNASLGQGYGTCTTAAATVAKVVTLSGYSLSTGGIVAVKFTYDVPANATMNVNSKGAKSIYYNNAAITAGLINAGDTAIFMYNGSQYILLSIVNVEAGSSGSVKKETVVVQNNNTTSITIPFTCSSSQLSVYYNGLLLTPSINYSVASNTITLLNFAAAAGDIITFIVSLNDGDEIVINNLPINKGGTGATTASQALINLNGINNPTTKTANDLLFYNGSTWTVKNARDVGKKIYVQTTLPSLENDDFWYEITSTGVWL